jgi:hypothetical protein
VSEDPGTGTPHLLIRVMLTGTPLPCPILYSAADCTGTALGVPALSATGLACDGGGGHAWRVVGSAVPAQQATESIHAPRWNGTDVVRECANTPGLSQPVLTLEDMGTFTTIASRVHVERG